MDNSSLVLDLVEWVARAPRRYTEVMEAWRTSCPRLSIWEDAVDQGYLQRDQNGHGESVVQVTAAGQAFLRRAGRLN